MLANWTQREPPVGTPWICLYQASSKKPMDDLRLCLTRSTSQALKLSVHSGHKRFMACSKASMTKVGLSESYNALKSKVKGL